MLFAFLLAAVVVTMASVSISSAISWRIGFEAGKRQTGISVATNLGKKLRQANAQLFEARRRTGDFIIPEESGAFVYKKALEEAIQVSNCASVEAALRLAGGTSKSNNRSVS